MFQDNVLSLLGSLMAILLVRWLSDPIPGYTWLLLKWLGAGLVGTIIGMLVTGSHKNVKTYISYTSAMKTSWTLLIKTIFLVVVMLVGFVKLPSISLAAMALLADFIASIFFVLYLRFSLTSLSRETGRVKDQVGKLTALVMGTGRAAVDLADEAAASGRYDVVGFLSADPAMSGMLIGNRMVYKCGNESEMKGIMQRLGGVDCILFTKDPDDGFPKDGTQEKDDPKNTVAQRDGMSLGWAESSMLSFCFDAKEMESDKALLNYIRTMRSEYYRAFKDRTFDITFHSNQPEVQYLIEELNSNPHL